MNTRLLAALVLTVALAGCTQGSDTQPTEEMPHDLSADVWHEVTLESVRDNETFTAGGFDRPVLVETFAIWCSTCLSQQKEVVNLHEQVGDDIVSIGLNIDPNEDAAQVASYAEQQGFHWRYAVSPIKLNDMLRQEFDSSILIPPRAPMVLVCPDGTTERLRDGVKPADELRSTVSETCNA